MGKSVIFIFIFCIALGMQGLSADEGFTWHLALVKNNQGLPFDDTVKMNDGESFSIDVFTERECYAYIIVEEASGRITPLLYRQIKAGPNGVAKLPVKLSPPAGQEKFYVVTSLKEQKDLQKAIDIYRKEKSDDNAALLMTMLLEINPNGNNNTKRVGFTGVIRAAEMVDATEFSGASVYANTIVISH